MKVYSVSRKNTSWPAYKIATRTKIALAGLSVTKSVTESGDSVALFVTEVSWRDLVVEIRTTRKKKTAASQQRNATLR